VADRSSEYSASNAQNLDAPQKVVAMSLLTPDRTPYDVNFRLYDIPVRVHPAFWIVQVFLGSIFWQILGISGLFIWIACAFVSILIHELGHVLMSRAFGGKGEIVLTIFGGHAGESADLHHRPHRILVYLAGPGAQLLLAGLVLTLTSTFGIGQLSMPNPPPVPAPLQRVDEVPDAAQSKALQEQTAREWDEYARTITERMFSPIFMTVMMLVSINIGWAVFNLIPIPPLDGGRILLELIGNSPRGDRKPWEQDPDWWKRG
jgi:stage IV sporulation protein FB